MNSVKSSLNEQKYSYELMYNLCSFYLVYLWIEIYRVKLSLHSCIKFVLKLSSILLWYTHTPSSLHTKLTSHPKCTYTHSLNSHITYSITYYWLTQSITHALSQYMHVTYHSLTHNTSTHKILFLGYQSTELMAIFLPVHSLSSVLAQKCMSNWMMAIFLFIHWVHHS